MIDVVFLLLIFFLVTTSFRTPTQSVVTAIVSPNNTPAATLDDVEQVTLAVGNQSGNIGYKMGGIQTNDISKVGELLKKLKPRSVQILVKVGDEIPFQSAVSVIELCKGCGHKSAAWFPNHER